MECILQLKYRDIQNVAYFAEAPCTDFSCLECTLWKPSFYSNVMTVKPSHKAKLYMYVSRVTL